MQIILDNYRIARERINVIARKFIQNRSLCLKNIFLLIFSLFILSIEGCGQMPAADLQNLTLPSTKNYYLICPKGFCNVQPNEYSPIYNVSAANLFEAWNLMLSKQLYVNITGTIPARAQYEYVQKSPFFGFPDYISVQFIAITDTTSTLAIYSRSRYGFYDFDVNKKRLRKWIAQLNDAVLNLSPAILESNTATTDKDDDSDSKNLNGLIIPGVTTDNSNVSGATSTNNSNPTSSNGINSTNGTNPTASTSTNNAMNNTTTTDNSNSVTNTTTNNSNAIGNTTTDNIDSGNDTAS